MGKHVLRASRERQKSKNAWSIAGCQRIQIKGSGKRGLRRPEERPLVGVGLILSSPLDSLHHAAQADLQQLAVAWAEVALVGNELVAQSLGDLITVQPRFGGCMGWTVPLPFSGTTSVS